MFNLKIRSMKNLANFDEFKLNKVQMNGLKGGISAKEYCKGLHDLYFSKEGNFSSEDEQQGFTYGWQNAECGKYYHDICY